MSMKDSFLLKKARGKRQEANVKQDPFAFFRLPLAPYFLPLAVCLLPLALLAQPERWQQQVNYEMTIDMNAAAHQYHGKQRLTYTNNSPDTLTRLFYHLYFNAFQPGSMMDVRSRNIIDPDSRVGARIMGLKPEEQGWIKVNTLTQDGKAVKFLSNETILEVTPAQPVLPHSSVVLEMDWDAQVPIQIRRSGRDSREGVAYSMSQWYPKLCEYDYQGWHANPYIGREFYGVWGDFDVKISIDKKFLVAAGGYLQNPLEVGNGYEDAGQIVKQPAGEKLMYHFKAPNVHDFVWAADPEYTHAKIKADDGTTMHFIWQKGQGYDQQWADLQNIVNHARTVMNERCGKYPYNDYYFIQGGDGGMEYPMATLMLGNRSLGSLVGTAVHEQLHSWYQMVLGTNESLYAWMDEGFTSYAETIVENELKRSGLMPGEAEADPFSGTYDAYKNLATSTREEPLSTHADHFHTNFAYSLAAYVKGSVFLQQLGYVIGADNLHRGLLRYFNAWKFKHPNVNDLVRVMEKESGLELDWYKEDFVNTLNTIDYSVDSVFADGDKTRVIIGRKGDMAMPLDIVVTYTDGSMEVFYAPLESMRGEKPAEDMAALLKNTAAYGLSTSPTKRRVLPDHRWVDPAYVFDIPEKLKKVSKVDIDPTHRMADLVRENNAWENKQ